ncbi:MAG: hydroxyacylglutathione hydrolase [Cocleimonas sp.]|nr:hydroxyacylglutathione hydrolase [Cocleimonas sp.]
MPTIIPISAFSDNYIWLICDNQQRYAAIVDPGDATPVIEVLEEKNIEPVAVLITHHHSDHIGGISRLLKKYPQLPVYGPKNERITALTHKVGQDDVIDLHQIDTQLNVLDTFGHTAGHISYYAPNILFCGDTLFANGCGRIFDGSIETLHQSLEKIAKLPPETRIYCAHEYTLDNIGFAKWVEVNNKDLIEREAVCWDLIDNSKSTIPTLLSDELKTNPFMRCDEQVVIEQAEKFAGKQLPNSTEVFRAIRHWKDSEYD